MGKCLRKIFQLLKNSSILLHLKSLLQTRTQTDRKKRHREAIKAKQRAKKKTFAAKIDSYTSVSVFAFAYKENWQQNTRAFYQLCYCCRYFVFFFFFFFFSCLLSKNYSRIHKKTRRGHVAVYMYVCVCICRCACVRILCPKVKLWLAGRLVVVAATAVDWLLI